ncbi:MAG: PAS domain-containing protein, partial [Campylobacterota bacterium]|nr:PAS domain-containing protein [Campylobacterota bacterium]
MNIDENKFLELIEQLPNMAVQGYDRERKVIYWNSASEVVYGYTKEEALGKKLEDLIIPDFMRNAVIEGVENWYEKGEAIPSSELQLQHKDGSGVYVYSSHIILYEDTDKPEMFCLDVDLSQQKNQEKELVSLNERMELALLGNSDALWDWNILTNDIYYSPRWKEMLGYSDDELPNEFTVWQGKMHQDDVENTLQDVQKHLSGESDFMDSTLRLRCKDESWIWVRCRAKAIFDEDGQAVRMIGTNTDITKDKEFELKYQEQTQMLKDSQRITKIGSWKLDLVENSLSWSDEIYRMFEIDSQTLPSYELFLDSIHPQDRVSVNEAYSKSLEDKKPYEIMHRLLLKNAKVRYVREQCETEFDAEGNPLVSVGTVQDITEQ